MTKGIKNPKINVLIVDENVEPLTLVVTRCLGIQSDWNLHILSLGNLLFPVFKFSKYVTTCKCSKFSDEDHAFAIIKETALKVNAKIIIPVNEKAVKIISARYKECLKFANIPPMPDLTTFNTVRNKWLLYNWLHENGFSNDKPFLLSEITNNHSLTKSLTFPLLVKPNWGSGGKGIIQVGDEEDLINLLSTNIERPHEFSVQPLIIGYDIDVSALVHKGEIISYTIQRGNDKKSKLVYSKSIEFIKNDRLLQLAIKIFKKLNYSGIAHLDFRFDDKQNTYKLIDFNARYWTSLLGSLSAGINFPNIALRWSMGKIDIQGEYQCQKYYVEANPIKILLKRIPIKNTELFYNILDPLPFLMGSIYKVIYHLKKLFG